MMLLTMKKLIEISGLEKKFIFCRNNFRSEKSRTLENLDLDYIIGIHFLTLYPLMF
jgi:hypothetical protein